MTGRRRPSYHGSGPIDHDGEEEEDPMEAYCLKCRTKREMRDEKRVTLKNGRPAVEGKCPVCGTRMFKIGGR
jgi:Zn finger protein HypA/HybF involved in hydrogenase expression